jgi:uncharacterized protein with ParB-like and HNH nuclease domain
MQHTQKVPVGDIFGDIKLNIPSYQRSYSWDETQVEDMFNDILYAVENYRDDSDKYHYFGTIVLEEDGKVRQPGLEWDKYNVIDGQQRLITTTILIRVISDELDSLSSLVSDDESSDIAKQLSEQLEDRFIERRTIEKLSPEDLSKKYYEEIIVEGEDVDDVVNEESPLVAHRIRTAVKTIQRMIESETKDMEDMEDRIDFLAKIKNAVSNDFRLTPNIMKNMDEASRMFKIINERGKDISTMDKIKSHLMYATTNVEGIEPEFVSSKINKAVRNVSKYPDSTDNDIDALAKRHFLIFTGEVRNDWINNYHKYNAEYQKNMNIEQRLQSMPWYANINREPEELEEFVRDYVESLEDLSTYFAEYRFYTKFDNRRIQNKEVTNHFHIMHNSGSQPKFEIYATAIMYAFKDKPDTLIEALREVRKPAIMYNQVMKNTGSYKRILRKLAHKVFWYEWSDRPPKHSDRIFNGREHVNLDLFSTKRTLMDEIKTTIHKKNKEKNIEETFRERLRESDIEDGDYTNGWGGVRSVTTIKMLLYFYEKSMRTSTGISDLQNLVDWCKNMEREHMIPKNPRRGEKIPHHNMQTDKLGNYLVLDSKDNQVANRNYEYKKEKIYDDLTFKMTEDLPQEANSEKIDERSLRIIEEVDGYL